MTKQITWVKRAITFHSLFVTHSSSFAALYSFLTPCKKAPVTRYKVTHYSLLFSESLVSRCKNRSLLVTKYALYLLQINFLLTPCKVQPSLITPFSFQNRSLVVAKIAVIHCKKCSLLVTNINRCSWQSHPLLVSRCRIVRYLLQNLLATLKNCSLLVAKIICYLLQSSLATLKNCSLLVAKIVCYSLNFNSKN